MSTSNSPRTITLASRASQLAQIQTNIVRDALSAKFPAQPFETSFMSTGGDQNQSQALYQIGGKALWTKELEVALKENTVDMLVHCCKDVPTVLPDGCEIAGVLEREDPVDSFIVRTGENWKTLEDLPEGSVVGTGSARRVAQLKRKFPKLVFKNVRGNVDTRLVKLDAPDSPYAAIILAKAGMVRLGWGDRITSDLGPPTLLHAVSQGALAIEIRADDEHARALCCSITHWPTEWRCRAERALLRVMQCAYPSSGDREGEHQARLSITGSVTSLQGDRHVEHSIQAEVRSVEEAEAVGARLAKVLIDTGVKEILDEISEVREKIELAKTTEIWHVEKKLRHAVNIEVSPCSLTAHFLERVRAVTKLIATQNELVYSLSWHVYASGLGQLDPHELEEHGTGCNILQISPGPTDHAPILGYRVNSSYHTAGGYVQHPWHEEDSTRILVLIAFPEHNMWRASRRTSSTSCQSSSSSA
ncbi:porphobilinogen deaminase, dipyromethane cofactor binding domain-containing protein [Dichomitus squalens]|uniref:hydroxymethylbilane synthase n=1 Tax=Dichomitus squalens TaxID=114155 RepID=A0A4Q9NB71_9APHY|nr:porphobilinogen deaminase, dipyromethane cofactor binding domain-containing protein [Dichomitus squalens]TBU53435.1 porphobilinogen deaminase, dipyromethane cofactor binding domain-containing protein [Dichomitus squalens]